jgi:hypothetical protein
LSRVIVMRLSQALALLVSFLFLSLLFVFLSWELSASIAIVGVFVSLIAVLLPSLVSWFYDYFARFLDPLASWLIDATVVAMYFVFIIPVGLLNPNLRRLFRETRLQKSSSYWKPPKHGHK